MTTETETAFTELLGAVSAVHGRMVEQLADDETTLLEAHKWIFSILQVAAEVQLWADTARPRFVEIVGPYKKWGGDNSDAFYSYAPIDPARTYRVVIHPGDAVYMSLTVYGGPDDGRYSERIVGTVNSVETPRRPDGTIHVVLSADEPAESDVAFVRLEPDAVAAVTRDYLENPRGKAGALGDRGRRPPRPLPPGRCGPGAAPAGDADVGDRAGGNRPDPSGCSERHRSALSRADHHLRMGRRRRRVRHGCLRARR